MSTHWDHVGHTFKPNTPAEYIIHFKYTCFSVTNTAHAATANISDYCNCSICSETTVGLKYNKQFQLLTR